MAYSLGIHREPRQFKHGFKDEKHNNLCRKIWHYLVFSDITQTYTFGNPLVISASYFDTKLPYNKEGNENKCNPKLEMYVLECYTLMEYHLKDPIQNILKLCLDVNGNTKITELTNLLEQLEENNKDMFGKNSSYMTVLDDSNDVNLEKSSNFMINLSLKCLIYRYTITCICFMKKS